MKKQVLKIFIILFIIFSFTEVKALSPSEIRTRTVCPIIELATAKGDGSLETVGCYNSYVEAKQVMDVTANDDLVLIEGGMIIDAKYALIDYDQTTSARYTGIYDSVLLNNRITYISGGNSDDAVYLGMDPNTGRIKIKVSGVVGYIARYENESQKINQLYDIVPVSWVQSASYYKITDSEIIHVLPHNLYNTKGTDSTLIGQKPEHVLPGNYYSYDGHYFYTDLKTMINDYKNNVSTNAVNASNPYYNYYQYLSFRTKTTYNAANLNQYIASRTSSGVMLNTGDVFIDAQNKYGANAALMFAIGMNESAFGNSNISVTKNNLFGLNATDKNTAENASVFSSVSDCIYNYAFGWLSYRYLQPGDFRFHGAMVGNKLSGLNVQYASDPYWGEKAASYYYQLDKMFGFQDYNTYTTAVLNSNYQNTVYAKKTPGGLNVSTQFYQYREKDSSVVVVLETTGPAVNGNTTWYQIMSDPDLRVSDLEYTGEDSQANPYLEYHWNQMKVYVPAAYFTKVNIGTNSVVPVEPVDPVGPSVPENPDIPDPVPTPAPTPTPPPVKAISEIISESGYRTEDGFLFGIGPNTSRDDVISRITSHGGNVSFNNGTIGTGVTMTITSGNLQESYPIIIYGDTDGDGAISAVDYVRVKNHIMGNGTLSGAHQKAADVNRDGSISAVDYVNIKNYIMGNDNVIRN